MKFREIMPFLDARLRRRFQDKLARRGQCIEYTGHLSPIGYGQISVTEAGTGQRFLILVHRLAWVIEHGQEVPEGLIICHRCNNPKCCNPRHLYAGTHEDNANDAAQAKAYRAMAGIKGPKHPRSKYDGELRRQAILMRATEQIPFAEIAAKIGCRRSTVERWWHEHEKAVAIAANQREAMKPAKIH